MATTLSRELVVSYWDIKRDLARDTRQTPTAKKKQNYAIRTTKDS